MFNLKTKQRGNLLIRIYTFEALTACVFFPRHSRPQRPRSFWSAPRIATSVQVQHRKSAITDLPSLCACSESSLTNLIGSGLNLLCLQSHSKTECCWTRPEVVLGADQKERGLWGRECFRDISVRFLSWECWDSEDDTIISEKKSEVFRSLRTRINASSLPSQCFSLQKSEIARKVLSFIHFSYGFRSLRGSE